MGEILFYKGRSHFMTSCPFRDYLKTRNDVVLNMFNTANYRGYIGRWEIRDNKLYLCSLSAFVSYKKAVDVDYFFPGQTEVIADWFSGELVLPFGELLEYRKPPINYTF